MNKSMVNNSIFSDGGCSFSNPSKIGGTWCWALVENNQVKKSSSGIITPNDLDLPTITNNVSELYAAYQAISSLPPDWYGTLYTDSSVTLHRFTHGHSFNGIPDWLKEEVLKLRKDKNWNVTLVAGHPTKAELLQGFRSRNGLPVSVWNKWCDEECTRLGKSMWSSTQPSRNGRKKRK